MSTTRVADPKSRGLVARPPVLRSVPLDRHAVIEASAGTGKTFTLEHLVVELVLAGDVPLDRVLVVTFTEKATNELRVRVRGKLEELLAGRGRAPNDAELAAGDFWTIDDAARAKLARALHAFDGATIATIHAFCQRVLRDNAFASGRLFEEQQVDGRDTFARAFREALRCDVARDPVRSAWLEAGLRAGFSVGGIEELLWSCMQAKAELRPAFDPRALDEAIAAFPVDEARRTDGPATLRTWGVHAATAKKLGSQMWELALLVERVRDGGSPQSFVLEAERDDVDLGYLLENLAPLGPRPGPTGRACAAALTLARATPSMRVALAAIVLPAVRAELARRKRLAGLYDFDDMLTLVDEALHAPSAGALVAAMRERWRYALIDEFQDTDETQWDIFRRAFFESRGDGAGASVLYLVGDPKQSIYRFRGADVQTYLRARDEIVAGGGALLRLADNYRATPALVGATNALFAEPYFTGRVAYEPVTCGRPDRTLVDGEGRSVTPLHVVRFERDVPVASYGALLAREIRRIADPERPWRLDGEPLGYRDVFVLTRTKAEGRGVAACLRAAGVPHAFYKEEGLFQTDEAKEIRALLDAVDAPHHRARRLAAWMTPFFGLPLEDVERARDLPATHPYVARLAAWKALADARDFDRLFESLVRDSGVVRREIFFADGERDLTNYLHVFELLLEQTRRGHCTLRDLVHLLTGLIEGTRLPLDLEGNVQRLESDRRAVQITTIHKAKGLEAPVVLIAGGWTQGRSDDVHVYHDRDRRLAWVGKARADVKALVSEEEDQEQQRLVYVALTRAIGRLVVPCILRDGRPDPRMRGPYEAINGRVAELAAAGGDLVSVEDLPRLVALSGGRIETTRATPWQPPVALLTETDGPGDHAALRESRAGAVVTSYTRMHAGRSSAHAAWAEPAERRIEKATAELDAARPVALRSARTSGVFLHEVLERVPLASFAAADFDAWRALPEVAAIVEDAMAVHRVGPEQREHAERLVWLAFTTPVALPEGATLARIADADRVVREMEFVFAVTGAGGFVRGSLDLAFEHRGRTYFVDWKTDSLASYARPALAAHVEAHYADQVHLYALATVKLLGIAAKAEHDARFGGLLYCFLRGFDERGAGLWTARPSWEDVAAWDEALARHWRAT